MDIARNVAEWSKDRSTKVGCVVVSPARDIRCTGYNGFPRGIHDDMDSRHERPAKYKWTEHAERNAIYTAARLGAALEGCTMYVPWFPCVDCARAIIQSGIAELVALEPDFNDERWGEDFVLAFQMLSESSVQVRYYREEA